MADASLPKSVNAKLCKKCGRKMLVPRPVPGNKKPVRVGTVVPTPPPVAKRVDRPRPVRSRPSPPKPRPAKGPDDVATVRPLPPATVRPKAAKTPRPRPPKPPLALVAEPAQLPPAPTPPWNRRTVFRAGGLTAVVAITIGILVGTSGGGRGDAAPVANAVAVDAPTTEAIDRVPPETIHRTVFLDVDVLSCFLPLMESGDLPNRVDLEFSIQPSGQASDIRISGPLAGSDLEDCLVATVGALSFPAIRGNPQLVAYPFIQKPTID